MNLDAKWLSNSLSLKQFVNVPTRGNRMLDFIFSNYPEYYNTPVTLPPLGLSDHPCVAWTPNHFIPNRQINSVVYRPFTPELVNLYKKWLTDRDWRDILSLSDGDKNGDLCVAWTPNHFIPNRQINSVVYRPFTPELVNLYKKWLTDRDWRDILSLSDGDKMASLFCKELFEKYCEIFPQKKRYL